MIEPMGNGKINFQLPTAKQSSEYFEALLRHVFSAGSDLEIADIGSRKLGCSARQVRNWLEHKHQPRFQFVWLLWMLAGHTKSTQLAIDIFGQEMGEIFAASIPPVS